MASTRGLLAARIVVGLMLAAAAWTLIASLVFLAGTRLIGSFAHPYYQWWSYLLYAPPNQVIALWLKIGAGVASAVVLVFAAALVVRRRKLGPSLRKGAFAGTPQPMRGATDNHGHADWLPIAKAREIFLGRHRSSAARWLGRPTAWIRTRLQKRPSIRLQRPRLDRHRLTPCHDQRPVGGWLGMRRRITWWCRTGQGQRVLRGT